MTRRAARWPVIVAAALGGELRGVAVLGAAGLLLAGLALCACSGGGDAEASARAGGAGGADRAVPVRVTAAQTGALDRTLERSGTLHTTEDIEVAARYGGRLVQVPVQIGDRVESGALLAKLDDRDTARNRQEAEAGLEVARATLRTAELDEERARRDLSRLESLAADQLITTQQLDDARTAAASALAQLDLSRAQVDQAQARLESLRLQLSETRLVAPFAGQIADRYHEAGDTVAAGQAVVRLVGGGALRARVQVPDRDAVQLAVGNAVTVRVDAFPGETFDGEIAGIAPAVDPDSGTMAIEAAVVDDSGRLLPGMFARITVELPARAAAVLVPAEALVDAPETGAPAVFVVVDGTAQLTEVVTGSTEGGVTEVLRGLEPGAQLVVGGQHLLRDGATVEILESGGAP